MDTRTFTRGPSLASLRLTPGRGAFTVLTAAIGFWLGAEGRLVDATTRQGAQQAMFAEGQAYERFMGRWSRQMAPLLVRFAGVRDGEAVLDVGSGTGALASAVASAMPSARITGVDPSPEYVAHARAAAAGDRIRFVVGDAQALDQPDAAFDRVLSLLVVNFIPDRERAIREMIRVTRPGGVVAAAVWDYGQGMEMLRVFWDEAVALAPAAAARDERRMPLCRQGELGAFWRAHGLQQVDEQPIVVTTSFASFEDYWSPFLGGQGPAGAYVASLAPADRTALENRLRRRLLGGRQEGPIVLQARAWAVKGVAPPR
jgi:SAM-dependent methyltransferase